MNNIVLSGASGQIGRMIVEELAQLTSLDNLTLITRAVDGLVDWANTGARVCPGDYRDPASLDAAYAGANTPMLISSLEIRKRVKQHRRITSNRHTQTVLRFAI